jgi:hypothetical protein
MEREADDFLLVARDRDEGPYRRISREAASMRKLTTTVAWTPAAAAGARPRGAGCERALW